MAFHGGGGERPARMATSARQRVASLKTTTAVGIPGGGRSRAHRERSPYMCGRLLFTRGGVGAGSVPRTAGVEGICVAPLTLSLLPNQHGAFWSPCCLQSLTIMKSSAWAVGEGYSSIRVGCLCVAVEEL